MVLEIIILVMVLLMSISLYIIWNLNTKVAQYEDTIETYQEWIQGFTDTVKDVDEKMKQIDSQGTFESDDEVGTFFQTLKILMNQITEYWEK
jgi:predicted PurR-regulated permease PerM